MLTSILGLALCTACGGDGDDTPGPGKPEGPDKSSTTGIDRFGAANIFSRNTYLPNNTAMQGFNLDSDGSVWYTQPLQHEPGAAELGTRTAQQGDRRANRKQGLHETHLLRPRDEHRSRRGRHRPLPVGRSLRRLQRQGPVLERKAGGARQIREGSHRQDQRVQRLLLHRRLHRPAPLDRCRERPADDQLRRQQEFVLPVLRRLQAEPRRKRPR